jgi:glycine/D-amino acid oxidase-like deaminating enzyme
VYYFGVPSNSAAAFDDMPVWIDLDGHDFYYGIPGNTARGFKVGVDKRGALFNPTTGDRITDEGVLCHARKFMHHRFPSLRDAPLIEARVCPYENSSTGNFIFDQHPAAENVFFLGGGSGHGFKHGPALGELVARCFAGSETVPALFSIA